MFKIKFNIFKKAKKNKHELIDAGICSIHNWNRALECKKCNKQYIMDVLGGWAVEYEFEKSRYGTVSKEQIEAAIRYKDELPLSEWFTVHEQECVLIKK